MSRASFLRPAFVGFVLALAGLSCGRGASEPGPASTWNPGANDTPIEVSGPWAHGRSEYLTLWHGVDPSLLRVRPEAILGDERDAVLTATPARMQVELAASQVERQLSTAVRRIGARPQVPTLFEVFWQAEEGALQSLTQVRLDPQPQRLSEPWTQIRCAVPSTAGTLTLVCRDPRPIGAQAPVTEVAWQSPVVAPSARTNSKYPDVLLVTIDTFRSDALAYAPRLSAVLSSGQVWTQAVSPSNWTLPSYASLFSGQSARVHQAGRGPFEAQATRAPEDRQLSAVDAELTLLAERFRAAGYATGMVHQNPMLETWTGFPRGFEQYQRASDRTEDALQACRSFFEAHEGRPRFFVLHLMAPHLPYRFGPSPDPLADLPLAGFLAEDHPPEQRAAFFAMPSEQQARVRERYYAEVARLDSELGPWLTQLFDVSPDLVLGFHSDHGEELWDAGSFEHGHSFDDSVIRVPIGIVAPQRLAAASSQAAVPAELLGASLLDLAGIEHELPHSLQSPPASFESSMPLYRAAEHGRMFELSNMTSIPFDASLGSGGNGALISEQKRRMLAELGYLAGQEMRPQPSHEAPSASPPRDDRD